MSCECECVCMFVPTIVFFPPQPILFSHNVTNYIELKLMSINNFSFLLCSTTLFKLLYIWQFIDNRNLPKKKRTSTMNVRVLRRSMKRSHFLHKIKIHFFWCRFFKILFRLNIAKIRNYISATKGWFEPPGKRWVKGNPSHSHFALCVIHVHAVSMVWCEGRDGGWLWRWWQTLFNSELHILRSICFHNKSANDSRVSMF